MKEVHIKKHLFKETVTFGTRVLREHAVFDSVRRDCKATSMYSSDLDAALSSMTTRLAVLAQ